MVDIIGDLHGQGFYKITCIKHVSFNQLIQFYVIDRLIHFSNDRDRRFKAHFEINYKFIGNFSFLFLQSMMSDKTKLFEYDRNQSIDIMKPFLA